MATVQAVLAAVRDNVLVLGVLVGLIAAAAVAVGAVRVLARLTGVKRPHSQSARVPGRRLDNVLTLLAAGVAESVGATGIWALFSVLGLPLWARVALFAFLSLATLTSALRARRNLRRPPYRAGVDGVAVWVLACLSAVLSALDSHSLPEVAVRLAAPLVAAWLWHRGLAGAAAEQHEPVRRIRWRVSVERVAVWLRLADASDRSAGDVDVARWLGTVARAAVRLDAHKASKHAAWRIRRARRRLRRATLAAGAHVGLGTNPMLRAQLREYLAVLYQIEDQTSRAAVQELTPWQTAVPAAPRRQEKPAQQAPSRPANSRVQRPVRQVMRRTGTPDVSDLLVPGREVRAVLASRGEALTKRSLIDGLRQSGYSVSAERALALLTRLKNDGENGNDGGLEVA